MVIGHFIQGIEVRNLVGNFAKFYSMSHMEEDIRDFFKRIVKTVSLLLLWLFIFLGLGIYNNWAIPVNGMQWSNYLFYTLALISAFFLFRQLKQLWSKKFPHG